MVKIYTVKSLETEVSYAHQLHLCEQINVFSVTWCFRNHSM